LSRPDSAAMPEVSGRHCPDGTTGTRGFTASGKRDAILLQRLPRDRSEPQAEFRAAGKSCAGNELRPDGIAACESSESAVRAAL